MRLRRFALTAALLTPAVPLLGAPPANATHCSVPTILTTAVPVTFATATFQYAGVGTGVCRGGYITGNCLGGTVQADSSQVVMVPAVGESCIIGADLFQVLAWAP